MILVLNQVKILKLKILVLIYLIVHATWEDIEVTQMISRNIDEEIDNLCNFCKIVMNNDIISGHNIIGFDNFQIYNRINWFLKNSNNSISPEKKKFLQLFVSKYSNPDKSFHFGIQL